MVLEINFKKYKCYKNKTEEGEDKGEKEQGRGYNVFVLSKQKAKTMVGEEQLYL